jgi:nucleotide-binding universal stress UspA family protein
MLVGLKCDRRAKPARCLLGVGPLPATQGFPEPLRPTQTLRTSARSIEEASRGMAAAPEGVIMETILCATDLSSASREATACAASLARALRAKLHLLHVVIPPVELPPDVFSGAMMGENLTGAEKELGRQAATLASTQIQVTTSVKVGFADEEVQRCAAEIGANLVVVGTHGRQGAARTFVGSVAERTVRLAPCPVLVVPAGKTNLATWTSEARPLRLTAGVDLSPSTDAALGLLRRLGERFRCEVKMVHLYWPPREHQRLGLPEPDQWHADAEAVEVLTRDLQARASTNLGASGGTLRVRPSWGAEDNPLAWEAETDDADLLVVGTSQGRHGGTAIDALRGAHVPVLCVPARLAATRHPALTPIRHVLVTTDFSPLGNAAVAEAYRLVLHGGVVTLANIVEGESTLIGPDQKEEIETCLLALVPRGANPHTIHTRVLVTGGRSPAEGIVQAVHRVGPDLVVMSSHGRTSLARAVRGSVTEEVIRTSPKPVVVVPRPVIA